MHYDFIKNLLNLKGVNVTKLRNRKNKINIHIELSVIPHKCPGCHSMTTKIHDYRNQEIKDIPLYDKRTVLIYRKRRFICKVCGKKFYEKNSFVAKNGRKTLRLTEYIIDQLRKKQSIKDIAKSSKVSSSTIFNLLPSFSVTAHTLPEVLCIDEFRGNVDEDSKYQVALLNGKTGETIDIIHNRLKDTLYDYFNHFSLDERKKVKYFVTDLWSTYKKLAQEYFPNAKIIADRFHYARYIVNCVDTIRKEVQSKLPKENRSEFMHSRKVLLSRKCNLKKEQLEILNNILINYSENLRIAYYEKERLLDIIHSDCSKTNKIERFNQWVKDNLDSDIPSLKDCAKTYFNWIKEIRNSLECKYNNGIMEGHNNKIKVLKRTAFGFRNFDNFKARILLLD